MIFEAFIKEMAWEVRFECITFIWHVGYNRARNVRNFYLMILLNVHNIFLYILFGIKNPFYRHRIKFGGRSSISFKYVATCRAKAATDSFDYDVVNQSIAHITNWLIKNNNIILLMKQWKIRNRHVSSVCKCATLVVNCSWFGISALNVAIVGCLTIIISK